MQRPITAFHVTALSSRLQEIKKDKLDSVKRHRFHPMRSALIKMRRKFGLTYIEIEAELKNIGLDDVSLSEVKEYFRAIGLTKKKPSVKRA